MFAGNNTNRLVTDFEITIKYIYLLFTMFYYTFPLTRSQYSLNIPNEYHSNLVVMLHSQKSSSTSPT